MDCSLKKGIFFDLDTEALKTYYPVDSWNNAYADIKRFLIKNGFEHTQGSGYHSLEPMSHAKAMGVIYDLTEKYPWINKCVNVCTLNDVPAQHDITNVFDKLLDIEKRNEKQNDFSNSNGSMKDYLNEIAQMKNSNANKSENQSKSKEKSQSSNKSR